MIVSKSILFLTLALILPKYVQADVPPSQQQHAFTQSATNPAIKKKVAIIGAGAAGSSAAYWLRGAFPPSNAAEIEISTTVYELTPRAGGRSTVIHAMEDPDLQIELGASIFINANWNLMNATKRFNLTLKPFRDGPTSLGIWDGKQFVFEESSWSWWDITKVLWRYGYTTPVKVRDTVLEAVNKFAQIYDHKSFPSFENIGEFVRSIDFVNEVSRTAEDYFLTDRGLYAPYITEIVQSATRGNYIQNTASIHALGALVSMAASGASSVKGGNYQIFEQFLSHSGARVLYNTPVKEIKKLDLGDPDPKYVVITKDDQREVYDAVLLAAPIHSCGIQIDFGDQDELIKPYYPPSYKPLYVTIVVGEPNPNFFGRASLAKMPTVIVTTPVNASSGSDDPETPSFITLGIHTKNITIKGEKEENFSRHSVVKMFSDARLSNDILKQLFHSVKWKTGKNWEAFPILNPIYIEDQDEPEKETKNSKNRPMPIRLDGEKFFYVNAFESVISTMETQTLASKNVVRLLHKEWCSGCEEFGDGWGWEDEIAGSTQKSKTDL